MGKLINGNSQPYLMDRLYRDNPELHDRVVAGELTPYKAAVIAGWRPKTLSVRIDKAEKVVEALRRHTTPEFMAEIARLINTGEE